MTAVEPEHLARERREAADALVRAGAAETTTPSPIPANVWRAGDPAPRPTPHPEMFAGPLGEFALATAEHSEADPVAVLAQALVMAGVTVNSGPHVVAGNDKHTATLFALLVGLTSKGGKGTSGAVVRSAWQHVDPALLRRVFGGFGSGEALIAELAPSDGSAPSDNRAVLEEPEFGALIAAGKREGSTTSATIRNAWDGRPLQNRTRGGGKLVAEGYHLGATGHIVAQELHHRLHASEVYNGFLNRWLVFWVERGRLQPDGGNVPAHVFEQYGRILRERLTAARAFAQVTRTPAAAEVWRDWYLATADDDPPGLLGAAVSRAAPQTLRLSLVLALADGSPAIDVCHVTAAAHIWSYCRASAAHIFGESTGSRDADRLLAELREAGEAGLTATEQRDLFSRHTGRATAARQLLERTGLAVTVTPPVAIGRPTATTYAVRSTP